MTASPPEALRGDSSAGSTAVAIKLMQRHFVMQAERPEHLGDVELVALDPSLRSLLFTDGTVTRTLEAHALSRVCVEVIAQSKVRTYGSVSRHLETPDGTRSVKRRVAIRTDASTLPIVWAESYIVPSRLPAIFMDVLDSSPDGIGDSLQQVKLESWREMLWYGLDSPPGWSCLAAHDSQAVLVRLYRVIAQGQPALLISESFRIERRSNVYRLAGSTRSRLL